MSLKIIEHHFFMVLTQFHEKYCCIFDIMKFLKKTPPQK